MPVTICNIYLTTKLLTRAEKCLPLHSVISFSVINYVVMMRHPRVSDEVSFCFIGVLPTVIHNTLQVRQIQQMRAAKREHAFVVKY